MKIVLATFAFIFGTMAFADERVLPAEVLLKMGFRPYNSFKHFHGHIRVQSDLPMNLQWPVQFADGAHSIAQNYVNFQQYGGLPYYHKGCDLRTTADSWVIAPITGVLEAGYYGYTDNPDGSETKMWKPWNGQTHDDPYFELGLVTADGYRFELHHVNSMNLPASTVAALNKGGVLIQAGTQLGHTYRWPDGVYHHVHYNIFRQDGVLENPEVHSIQVPDHVAPTIHGVYGIKNDGTVVEMKTGGTVAGPLKEIIVATTETRDNSVYVQTPPFVGIKFATGESTVWDFRHLLLGPTNKWPDIREVFVPELRVPGGKRLVNFGQYGKGMFLMRLRVPASQGAFSIKVGDTAGNFSSFDGILQ